MKKIAIIFLSIMVTLRILRILNRKYHVHQLDRLEADQWIRTWAEKILSIAQVSYEIDNPYSVNLESDWRPYLIMSNHASLYDIPLIFMIFPKSIRMIAKRELFHIPFWGKVLTFCEFFSLDRKNPRQAVKDLQIVQQRMQEGLIPWIAPEGTRTRTGELGPFKKGGFMVAQKVGAMIIPVGICDSRNILPAKTLNFQKGVHIRLRIGRPIDTRNYSFAQQNQLIQIVRNSIQELIHPL